MGYGDSTFQKVKDTTTDIGNKTINAVNDLANGPTGQFIGKVSADYGNTLLAGYKNSINAVTNNGAVKSLLGGANGSTQTPSTPAPVQAPVAPTAAPTVQSSTGATYGVGQSGGSQTIAQTLLTGAGGIDPNSLTLGKNTLLGNSGNNS